MGVTINGQHDQGLRSDGIVLYLESSDAYTNLHM